MSYSGHPRPLHYHQRPMMVWLNPPPIIIRPMASYSLPSKTRDGFDPAFTPRPSDHQSSDLLLSAHHPAWENHGVFFKHPPSKGGSQPFPTILTTCENTKCFDCLRMPKYVFPILYNITFVLYFYMRWNRTKEYKSGKFPGETWSC